MKVDFNNEIFGQFSAEEFEILKLILSNAKDSIHINKKITVNYTDILNNLKKDINIENKNWLYSIIINLTNKILFEDNSSFSFFQGLSIPISNPNMYILQISEAIYKKLFLPLYAKDLDTPLQISNLDELQ